jgi:hypothetical protein
MNHSVLSRQAKDHLKTHTLTGRRLDAVLFKTGILEPVLGRIPVVSILYGLLKTACEYAAQVPEPGERQRAGYNPCSIM